MSLAVAGPSRPPRSPSPKINSERHSLVSTSAASFRTAHSGFSPSQSRASIHSSESTHTVSRNNDEDGINPISRMAKAGGGQEIHIVKVSGDKVEVHNGTPPESLLNRAGKAVPRVFTHHDTFVGTDRPVGPPPPSPPASVEHDKGDLTSPPSSPPPPPPPPASSKMAFSRSEPPTTTPSPSPFDHGPRITPGVNPRDFMKPRSSLPPPTRADLGLPSTDAYRPRGTTPADARSSTRPSAPITPQRLPRSSLHADEPPQVPLKGPAPERLSLGPPTKTPQILVDGYLQPPSPSFSRPTRRNTTGSAHASGAARPSRTLAHFQHHSSIHSGHPATYEEGDTVGELDSDILQQAHQIRRERLSKRKAQQEAEAALTRAHEDQQVLVGNLIGEDHVNYVLMYNMLTGIRIGVSRCQAKIKRPLTDEDFTARHKFSFDIVGNELTPSAKYDFKFKDYAPWVFRELREDYFRLDPADYLLSLTAKYILSELGSPGKSGSFFYFSRDYRFIIKTIHHTEHKFLRRILKSYYTHVKENPHTLLSRFYGLHRVKLPHGRKIHFVIMNNLFPPHKDIHETYDLKGSTVGRLYPEEKAAKNPRATLKDLNWINRGKSLELGPEKRALLTEQLRRDAELLKKLYVMDYSLLIGIHNMQRGNRDNVRSNTLKVFSPTVPAIRRKPTSIKGTSPEAMAMRRAMRESDPKRLGAHDSLDLPEKDTGDRQQFIFYQDEGGLQATDEANAPQDTIYYLGVIDILTPYTMLKRVEHLWKGCSADRHKISPVPPVEYGNRFFEFMKAIMRGGGGGEKFKAE